MTNTKTQLCCIPHEMLFNPNLSILDLQIFHLIQERKDKDGFALITSKYLMNELKISRRTLGRSLNRLEKESLILGDIMYQGDSATRRIYAEKVTYITDAVAKTNL